MVSLSFVKDHKCRKHLHCAPGGKGRVLGLSPRGPNSVITCRIDLKLGGNVSPDIADNMHFDSWPYDHPSRIFFKKFPWGISASTCLMPLGHEVSVYGMTVTFWGFFLIFLIIIDLAFSKLILSTLGKCKVLSVRFSKSVWFITGQVSLKLL